jgi:hypothetical protein
MQYFDLFVYTTSNIQLYIYIHIYAMTDHYIILSANYTIIVYYYLLLCTIIYYYVLLSTRTLHTI